MAFELTILGSNAALPTSEKFSTAQVLNANERFFLIDCAEGTQIQLRKYRVRLSRISHAFISHVHGDHFLGVFGLIATFGLLGRKAPFHLFAPHALEEMLNIHWQYAGTPDFPVHFHPLAPGSSGLIWEDKRVEAYTFPVSHRIPTHGFLFKEKLQYRNMKKAAVVDYQLGIKEIKEIKQGQPIQRNGKTQPLSRYSIPPMRPRTYAYSADTRYDEKIIPFIKEADLLYHEATFDEARKELAYKNFHSTARQAGEIARKAAVGQLLIGHVSARYKGQEGGLLQQAQAVFPNTRLVQDGDVFAVPPVRLTEEEYQTLLPQS